MSRLLLVVLLWSGAGRGAGRSVPPTLVSAEAGLVWIRTISGADEWRDDEVARIVVSFDQPVYVHGVGSGRPPAAAGAQGALLPSEEGGASAPPGSATSVADLVRVVCPSGNLSLGSWDPADPGSTVPDRPGLLGLAPYPPDAGHPRALALRAAFRPHDSRPGSDPPAAPPPPHRIVLVSSSAGGSSISGHEDGTRSARWPAGVRDELLRGGCVVAVNGPATGAGAGGAAAGGPGSRVLGGYRAGSECDPGARVPVRAWAGGPASAAPSRITVWQLPEPVPGPPRPVADTNSSVRCEEVPAFVEEKMVFLEEGVRQMGGVVKSVMGPLASPMGDQFTTMLSSNGMDIMPQTVMHSVQGGVSRLVTAHVSNAVARNVSNILTDALTHSLTNTLTDMLTNTLGPALTSTVSKGLAPRVTRALTATLGKSLPDRVGLEVPELLERSLPILLVEKLTRSVTHAVVPTLTQTLSRTASQEYPCRQCFENNLYCSQCRSSAESLYHINYYSAYYAGYYSDFYAEYYAHAMFELQKLQFGGASKYVSIPNGGAGEPDNP